MTSSSLVLRLVLLVSMLGPAAAAHAADAPAFPLKASADGHHLVDQTGKPFLVHGDSPWEAVWQLTKAEWAEYLDRRAAQGFNSVILNLLPDNKPTHPWTKTRDGEAPFSNPKDFGTANAAYFDHAEWFVNEAKKRGLLVALFPCYLGIDHDWIDELHENGVDKARGYGAFLAQRFGKYPNILWVLGGDIDPEYASAEQDALALSLFTQAPHQLITFHGREHTSAWLYPDAKWLGVNVTYGYGETYTQSHADWSRQPVRPILMSEAGYEREANDSRAGTPQRVRRQAYWALLAGSAGHFYGTYYWDFKPAWREQFEWPGARHMKYVREFFEALPWSDFVPRFEQSLIVNGNGPYGSVEDYVTAAATPDRRVAALYMPIARALKLDLGLFPDPVRGRWFDPTTGRYTDATEKPLANQGTHLFTPPPRDGDTDWALVLTADPVSTTLPPPATLASYELRIYHARPGQVSAIREGLRGTLGALQARHGLQPVASWVSQDAQQGELVFQLLQVDGPDAADSAWRGLYADPEFKTASEAAKKAHGQTYTAIETISLVAPPSAVHLDTLKTSTARAFSLRLLQRRPGQQEAFKTLWREHGIGVQRRHRLQSLGWWEAVDREHAGLFVTLLAAESAEVMTLGDVSVDQDGGWQRALQMSAVDGRLLSNEIRYQMTTIDLPSVK